MIRHILSLVAEQVIRDGDTNVVSIINLLEGLVAAEGFPFGFPRLAFLSIWERDPEDPDSFPFRFTAEFNGQVMLEKVGQQMNFRGRRRNRTTIAIGGLVMPRAGHLTLTFALEDGPSARVDVEIKGRKPKDEAPGSDPGKANPA